jgi:phenylacetate-coenzyme A ligase PaaK-like adenylate-forming protein
MTFLERAHAARQTITPQVFARSSWSAAQIAELQIRRLRELLACAAERSPFWTPRLRGLDAARCGLADLARIAPVSKAELMHRLDDVFTDRALTRARAEDAIAATSTATVPILDRYLAQATGGSSGLRGVFVSDLETLCEVMAGALRAMARTPVANVAMIAAPSPVHSTGLAVALRGPDSPGPTLTSIPVTLPFAEIVARLETMQPQQLLGYPTLLARLARERAAGRLSITPIGVASTSEMLTPELRAAIRAGFGVPIVDVFGTTEGLMGGGEPDGAVFAFNSDTCIVELVDERDEPVPAGTPSHHVLITNLANRVQPLIRYRIDDSFTRQPDAPDHGHLRATVEGRVGETLRWGPVEVHPIVIRALLLKHPEVIDYRVAQTPIGVDVEIVGSDAACADALERALAAELARAGLAGARASVRAVDSLARGADTGKLRRFVPLPPAP